MTNTTTATTTTVSPTPPPPPPPTTTIITSTTPWYWLAVVWHGFIAMTALCQASYSSPMQPSSSSFIHSFVVISTLIISFAHSLILTTEHRCGWLISLLLVKTGLSIFTAIKTERCADTQTETCRQTNKQIGIKTDSHVHSREVNRSASLLFQ